MNNSLEDVKYASQWGVLRQIGLTLENSALIQISDACTPITIDVVEKTAVQVDSLFTSRIRTAIELHFNYD